MSWMVDLPTLTDVQAAGIMGLIFGVLIEAAVRDWWTRRKRLDDTPMWALEEIHDYVEEMIQQKRDAWSKLENPSHHGLAEKVKAEREAST